MPALFPGLLGDTFETLPAAVRRLHCNGTCRYAGEIAVERGEGWLSRLCGWAARLPPAFHGRLDVQIDVDRNGECWARVVNGHVMRSTLWAQDGLLRERLGLLTFGFRLSADPVALRWRVVQARLLGLLPLRACWFDDVVAAESAEGDRYHFDVRAALPLAGLLVHYRGWLHVA